jgi:hypothetical protein
LFGLVPNHKNYLVVLRLTSVKVANPAIMSPAAMAIPEVKSLKSEPVLASCGTTDTVVAEGTVFPDVLTGAVSTVGEVDQEAVAKANPKEAPPEVSPKVNSRLDAELKFMTTQ